MKEREYDIAVANSRLSKKWKNKKMSWHDIVKACSETTYTRETVAEYGRMTRDEQSNIKDVGGFVGGYLSEGTRKTGNVKWRSVATLDIDYGTSDVWDDFTMGFDCAAIMYSTHKHSPKTPRSFPLTILERSTSATAAPTARTVAAATAKRKLDCVIICVFPFF